MRFNSVEVGDLYEELGRAINGPEADPGSLGRHIDRLWATTGVALRLRDQGIPRESLAELATDAASQWTAEFNPRPVSETDLLGIYETAY